MNTMYKKSPLIEVIYQVRVPTILLINNKDSAEFISFWNEIKTDYPEFSENFDEQKEISINPDGTPSTVRVNKIKNFVFLSEDKLWKVNLTNSFLSLSTHKYEHWNDFSKRLTKIITVFQKIFSPLFYTRVGLRYIDLIQRSRYKLDNIEWKEIIKPYYLGNLINLNNETINSYISEIESLSPNKKIGIKSHIELVNTQNINTNLIEKALVFDTDYYINSKTELDQLEAINKELHSQSHDFIHNAVEKMLEEKMEPTTI